MVQHVFRLQVQEPAHVDKREEQIPQFIGNHRRFVGRHCMVELMDFFVKLPADILDTRPVETSPCSTCLDALRLMQGR
ncbi:MAG: hypothetical protein A2498_12685 [Lentisphaerae bacterium RIFOXYC12_FULL_60_16]|nr:MAG: hypothetical protein A2498_12685 [Lentisphaerae bacterium RIFOXYC12_FULL_60_16]OGV73660.1 MAG: hypothetical protein A2269_02945 [Lentisphaerae bacterium RIFOXYA12_FULL_60_10]OGV85587.1 MAG: hypothetical protein A2340_07755 [Lentisphaerae bacterium RIFOXYB12_FULL_60_10]